jgi:hypothetical protein
VDADAERPNRGDGGEDPALEEQMEARINLHGDESFEFGLTCLLDGIAARNT